MLQVIFTFCIGIINIIMQNWAISAKNQFAVHELREFDNAHQNPSGTVHGDLLVVDYNSYNSMPPNYYEKLGEPPESFVINKTTYDIVSNSGNSTAAWTTPHFECFVSVSTDIEVLRRIISSMQ